MDFDDELLDELARVYAHSAVDRFIAEQMATAKSDLDARTYAAPDQDIERATSAI